jgi:hypothetical protein
VLTQARLFREAFGRDSVCGVNHCCRWTGWADPALDEGGREPRRQQLFRLGIAAYEVGYEGEEFLPQQVHQALELAVRQSN